MPPLSRRAALGSGLALGAAAGLGTLADVLLGRHHRNASLGDVEHVIVFMQENRSFDHYFGTLSGVRGFGDPTAPRLPDGASVFDQKDAHGTVVRPWHLDTATTDAQEVHDLDHSWEGTHSAWNLGHYDGWITAKSGYSMGYYTRADIPFHYALADAFTVCDANFCSVMGPTNPNRLYLWTGTIDPYGAAGGPVTKNFGTGYHWTTYPERLQKAGVSWKVYQQADNYDDNALAWFTQYATAPPDSPLAINGLRKLSADDFAHDVAAGKLPRVSWIIAPTEESEHPDYPPAKGAHFTATRVLQALADHPDVWRKTVLFLNYDENDGFFDHVIPPTPPHGTLAEFVGDQPIGLGPRVPMTVISPWTSGGRVCSEVFDHTSVLRFLEAWTGVREANISDWRRTICGDLTSAFDFTRTQHAFPKLPDTQPMVDVLATEHAKPAAEIPAQAGPLPAQEPGTRPKLPNGYAFQTSSDLDQAGVLHITLTNTGTLGANLSVHVYQPVYSAESRGISLQYTLKPGEATTFATPIPPGSGYDLAVHGPDGYRHTITSAAASPTAAPTPPTR